MYSLSIILPFLDEINSLKKTIDIINKQNKKNKYNYYLHKFWKPKTNINLGIQRNLQLL